MAADYSGRSFVGTPATAPGPLGPDMLKAFAIIRRNPLDYLHQVWQAHGDVVQFPIPRPPSYLVNDPEGVRRVLVSNARNYGKSTIQYRSLSLVTGDGLLVADGETWRRQRRMVQPAFHHKTLEGVVAHIEVAVQRIFQQWEAAVGSSSGGAVVDIDGAMMHAALEVVGHALFGTDLSADAEALASATLDALEVVVARARVPITPPAWVPTPGNRRLASSVRRLDGAVEGMIAARQSSGHDASADPRDMLDMLMTTTDEAGDRLTREEIRDQIVTFIVAGHETVASALTWAWGLLAQHPDVQERLRRESDSVLGGRAVTFEDFPRLPFARAVLDETLRLYPPAWLITRKATQADEIAGHEIPEGALLIVSPWLLHRHPAVWAEPGEFRPERFLDGSADRNSFIPFGAGPRMCIGRDFAYVEATLILASIAARYSVSFDPGQGLPTADPLVTIRPTGGLRLRVTPREKASPS
jgi:cytochrome P450